MAHDAVLIAFDKICALQPIYSFCFWSKFCNFTYTLFITLCLLPPKFCLYYQLLMQQLWISNCFHLLLCIDGLTEFQHVCPQWIHNLKFLLECPW